MNKDILQRQVDDLVSELNNINARIEKLQVDNEKPKRNPYCISDSQAEVNRLHTKANAINRKIIKVSFAVNEVTQIVGEFISRLSVPILYDARSLYDYTDGYRVYPGRIIIIGDGEVLKASLIAKEMELNGFEVIRISELTRHYMYGSSNVTIEYKKVI